jgi:hypothetical protein
LPLLLNRSDAVCVRLPKKTWWRLINTPCPAWKGNETGWYRIGNQYRVSKFLYVCMYACLTTGGFFYFFVVHR